MTELSRPSSELKRLLVCACCGNAANLHFCGRCKKVAYCCVEHQKQSWPQHKAECKKLQDATTPSAAAGATTTHGVKKNSYRVP